MAKKKSSGKKTNGQEASKAKQPAAEDEAIRNVRHDGIRILCFGGSNTFAYSLKKQYALVLKDLISKKSSVPVFVVNAGETGAVAQESHDRFVNDVIEAEPALVIFEFGQHERDFKIAPASLYNTLKDMIEELRLTNCKSLLIAPTLVQDRKHFENSVPYATMMESLSKETGSLFVNPAAALKIKNGKAASTLFRNRKDHMHWSEKGQDTVGKMLAEAIIDSGIVPVQKR